MSDFVKLVKGEPNWDEKYNLDFESAFTQLSNKANAASPALTGTATLNGKEIATIESGTWSPILSYNVKLNSETNIVNPTYTADGITGHWEISGSVVHIRCSFSPTTISDIGKGLNPIITGFPVMSSGPAVSISINKFIKPILTEPLPYMHAIFEGRAIYLDSSSWVVGKTIGYVLIDAYGRTTK